VVSDKTWKNLQACAEAYGLPMAMLSPMKPWMCAQMLTLSAVTKAGYDAKMGTDHYFFQMALKHKKHIVPLETVGEQLDAIQRGLEPLGEQVLAETIEELNDVDKSLGELVRCWREGDDKGLEKLLKEMDVGGEKAFEILLLDRNKKWVPKLENTFRTPIPPPKTDEQQAAQTESPKRYPKRLFVVVGAGHLVGRGSVVELLQKRGWTVTRE
jgi:uncharacterized protein YbaP (TraB family)